MLSSSSLSAFLAVLMMASQGNPDTPIREARTALVPSVGVTGQAPKPDCVMPLPENRGTARQTTQVEH